MGAFDSLYIAGTEAELRSSMKVRIIVNQNDFIFEKAELVWLGAAFGEELTSFEMGGHLRNLANDTVEKLFCTLTPIRAR